MTMRHVVAGTLTALLTHRSYTALAQSQSPSPPLGSCRMTASCNVSSLFCNCENASSKASLFFFFESLYLLIYIFFFSSSSKVCSHQYQLVSLRPPENPA